jgi:membrane protein DedA with SNARE-associated domain
VDFPSLTGALDSAVQALGPGTYAIVAVVVFSEMVAGLGLISPGETLLFIAGGAAADGHIQLGILIAVAWSAAVAGDMTGYTLGRRRGRSLLGRSTGGEARLRKLDAILDRWGALALVGGRFFGPVRAFAPFLAGASRMPRRRMVPASIAGAGAWTATMILAGFGLASSLEGYLNSAGNVVLAAGAAVLVIWLWRGRRFPDRQVPAET